MIYLASEYEERVGEVFESQVTRLNAWKGARVQRMHVRARMGAREDIRPAGVRGCARAYASARGTRGHAWQRAATGVLFIESMSFTQNEEINLK
ncbi:hypothetical protein CDL15_Pgr023970 [Punica granatum]|uniref:Uncharacterized protein n=1 Tax=Punica granatum TaxID=22663 RepID=A0A218WUA4_PUNGR|nr:hypothetical protein CDL15_Pgr023970 [Punica granatum]PKI53738.1 hypothetical protein CRG98_025868 [Punica granatum]